MVTLHLSLLFILTAFSRTLLAIDSPIIGVLSQDVYYVDPKLTEKYHSFISASYVKFLESAGARVVPIFIEKDRQYYEAIVNYTNGILFPGGSVPFNSSDGYTAAGQIIYDLATKLNSNGDYYPIWGTCQGMELIPFVSLHGKYFLRDCSAEKISLPLEFKTTFIRSKMFSLATDEILEILKTKNVTYNHHVHCYTEKDFRKNNMTKDWIILSTNKDVNGLKFISSFESRNYPIYAVQFHPEKANFEFIIENEVPHSLEAVKVSQYFANFFVEEARKNNHRFPDWKSEMNALIYNYSPQLTALEREDIFQMYLFERNVTKPNKFLYRALH